MNLFPKQIDVKDRIIRIAEVLGVDPLWAVSIAMVESSLGMHQKSPTGCKGVFQMSSIAMKDLLEEMEKGDDDLIDIACGLAFLHLLKRRHHTIEEATEHFCDPADRGFYVDRVKGYMKTFTQGG